MITPIQFTGARPQAPIRVNQTPNHCELKDIFDPTRVKAVLQTLPKSGDPQAYPALVSDALSRAGIFKDTGRVNKPGASRPASTGPSSMPRKDFVKMVGGAAAALGLAALTGSPVEATRPRKEPNWYNNQPLHRNYYFARWGKEVDRHLGDNDDRLSFLEMAVTIAIMWELAQHDFQLRPAAEAWQNTYWAFTHPNLAIRGRVLRDPESEYFKFGTKPDKQDPRFEDYTGDPAYLAGRAQDPNEVERADFSTP